MNELKNPFALKNERIISINDLDESDRGLKCGCICPVCKGKFEAKMGDVREHHFAHTGTPCDRTLQYVNSVYMLVEQCLREVKVFSFPGLTEERYSIFDGGTLAVKNAEVQYKPNGMAYGIVINENDIALRLNLKMEYCVGEVKTPFEGLSTILVDLQDIDVMTSAEIASLLCHDIKCKSWIYSKRVEKVLARIASGFYIDGQETQSKKMTRQSDYTLPMVTCSVCRSKVHKDDARWGNNTRRYYCYNCIENRGLNWREL